MRTKFVLRVLGATAAALMATIAGAAAATPLSSFTVGNITPILQAAGATDLKNETLTDGTPRIEFKVGARIYVADFYECQAQTNCKALQFQVAFEPNAADTLAAVNSFNDTYIYGKAALAKDNALISMRMVNGRVGSSDVQVTAELAALVGVTEVLLTHMAQSTPVAMAPSGKVATLAYFNEGPSDKQKTLVRNKRPAPAP
jgi:hypothetical protein